MIRVPLPAASAWSTPPATLSFVGPGPPDSTPSWGTPLQEAGNVAAIAHYPWVLLPGGRVFVVTWNVNVMVAGEELVRPLRDRSYLLAGETRVNGCLESTAFSGGISDHA